MGDLQEFQFPRCFLKQLIYMKQKKFIRIFIRIIISFGVLFFFAVFTQV